MVVGFITKRALAIVPSAEQDHQWQWTTDYCRPTDWCLVCTSPAAGVPRHTGRSFHVRSSVINNARGKMVVNISSGHISSQFSVQTLLKTWHLPISNVVEKREKVCQNFAYQFITAPSWLKEAHIYISESEKSDFFSRLYLWGRLWISDKTILFLNPFILDVFLF